MVRGKVVVDVVVKAEWLLFATSFSLLLKLKVNRVVDGRITSRRGSLFALLEYADESGSPQE